MDFDALLGALDDHLFDTTVPVLVRRRPSRPVNAIPTPGPVAILGCGMS
jgi:hypothetical protein